MKKNPSKYALYQEAVQDPEVDLDLLTSVYRREYKKNPQFIREDFCGTFFLSSEWVKRNKANRAVVLDLDRKPLNYGRKHNLVTLNDEEKSRLEIRQQTVLSVTKPKSDLIVATNFSYSIFKTREDLVKYFRYCYQSVKTKGMIAIDVLGGADCYDSGSDSHMVYPDKKNPHVSEKFRYKWEQTDFNPITGEVKFYISFKLNSGKSYKRVFRYDWRLWTIPELREAMAEAGFSKSVVYWEEDDNVFRQRKHGDNWAVWLAYIAAFK